MNDRQRLRREDPARTEPIRNWSTLYRRSDSWGSRDSVASAQVADEATRSSSWSDVVAHGVELGYGVIEEHMRQGRRVAQQINPRSYNPEAIGNDIQELAERMFRSSTELGALLFDLADSLAATPALLRDLLRTWQSQSESPANVASANGKPADEASAVSIEIVFSRPTQVTLDLHPRSARLSLTTHGLRALDPDKPPLSDITFEPSLEHGQVSLRIRVPEGHPSDLYTGVVIDQKTGQPQGTLSVRIID